jgi:hypothetical protein
MIILLKKQFIEFMIFTDIAYLTEKVLCDSFSWKLVVRYKHIIYFNEHQCKLKISCSPIFKKEKRINKK